MILTVTPNAALDLTYRVPVLRPGGSHRVSAVSARAGGKGVNVSRVLHTLGHDTLATGLVGGDTGAAIRADLAAAGIPEALVTVEAESRRTVTVVSDHEATVLNEPGPEVSSAQWSRFVAAFAALVERARVVVLAGSLPPGAPVEAYARLIGAARVPTILDTSGPALSAALPAGPDLVKPNAAELAAATGLPAGTPGEVTAAARRLLAGGARAVVVSLGEDGLLAVTESGTWHARVPPVSGNPTGAGDATVAALAIALARGRAPVRPGGWGAVLGGAAALGAAAVAAPLAGDVDLETYRRLVPVAEVETGRAHPDS